MNPPRNRLKTKLAPLDLRISDQNGTHRFDPNGLVLRVLTRGIFVPRANLRSELSLEPGVVYRADDLRLVLTPDELRRLVLTALKPAEFFALRQRYGDAFEWHDDFYDQETGDALQPKE